MRLRTGSPTVVGGRCITVYIINVTFRVHYVQSWVKRIGAAKIMVSLGSKNHCGRPEMGRAGDMFRRNTSHVVPSGYD